MGNFLFKSSLGVLFFFAFPVFAQVWVPSGTEMRRPSALQFDSGASLYQGDYYAYISPNFTYNHGSKFGYSVSLPVNVLLVDRNPLIENSRPGKVRDIDYNSRVDYSKILNYLSYGTYNQQVPGKVTYSFFAGRMIDGYIGHGTIINKYMSSSRFDSYNPGVVADINTDYGGAQYFSNSAVSLDVNAVRVYIKPLAIGRKVMSMYKSYSSDTAYMMPIRGKVIDEAGRPSVEDEVGIDKKKEDKKEVRPINKDSRMEIYDNDAWYNRMTIGYTNAFDRNAPKELAYNTNGSPVTVANLDNPKTKETSRLTVEGFDLEYRLLNLSYMEFTPYVDVNRIKEFDKAQGTHYGAIFRLGTKDLNIIFKPEFRNMSSNYIPMYFDSFYEVERFQTFPVASPMRPKYDTIRTLPSNSRVNGYYHTLYINFFHFGFEFAVEDYGGKNNSRVFLASYIPIGSSFMLSFYYTKKGHDRNGNAFTIDDNAQAAAELSKSFGPLMLRVQNLRRYVLDVPEKSFSSIDEIRFLVSGGISF